jgi:hypothetical protein
MQLNGKPSLERERERETERERERESTDRASQVVVARAVRSLLSSLLPSILLRLKTPSEEPTARFPISRIKDLLDGHAAIDRGEHTARSALLLWTKAFDVDAEESLDGVNSS